MRTFGALTRRAALRLLAGITATLLQVFTRPLRARAAPGAEPDYYSDTDFVGKTKAGRFQKFYINYWKSMRRIDPRTWTLRIDGLCQQPMTLTLKDIQSFPKKSQTSRLKCVECWSAKAEWSGFHFSELIQRAQPHGEAVGVLFHCADNYKEYLSLDDLRHPRTLMVTDMDDAPLVDEHGFPLRIIAPSKYGYKNPKSILRIEFVSETTYGTWSKIGPYSTDGTILPGTDHPLDFGKQPRRISGGEITDY